jgi:hypothetical protein
MAYFFCNDYWNRDGDTIRERSIALGVIKAKNSNIYKIYSDFYLDVHNMCSAVIY